MPSSVPVLLQLQMESRRLVFGKERGVSSYRPYHYHYYHYYYHYYCSTKWGRRA
jgi:hypothetical protein